MKRKALGEVRCPNCGKKVPWTATEKFRPFCSERCKLIDFGDWAAGEHAIPGESIPRDEETPGNDEDAFDYQNKR